MDRLSESDLEELAGLCPGGLLRNVELATISQWRIGGRADTLLRPSSSAEVAALRQWFSKRRLHAVVIGLTSNLLFPDEGVRAPIIQISQRMSGVTVDGLRVWAQAGVWVPGLARRLMQAGLSGAEHICGIPGTLGGLICMNGGSQRKGIGTSLIEVESVDAGGVILMRQAQDCGFAYRRSVYQVNGEVITGGVLRFQRHHSSAIRSEMRAILAERRCKFPRKEPNCGSVFKSNPAMYAEIGPPGEAIERLGFKGMRVGGALVSPHHANFIVNTGGATAQDVLTLIARIRAAVADATGYSMEVEACFVGPDGAICAADPGSMQRL